MSYGSGSDPLTQTGTTGLVTSSFGCELRTSKESAMIGRKAAVGMALLCALVFSAVMASSASAITGTTAFTCAPDPEKVGAGFKDAHCREPVASGRAFKHDAIAENTTTKTHVTNEKTNETTTGATVLTLVAKEQPFVGETEIQCKQVLGHGDITNDKDPATGEHTIHGTKGTLHYRECDFTKPGFCKVVNRTILVEGLTATSAKEEHNLLFKPEAGTTFTTIFAEGFGCPKELKVEGEVTVKENGATLEYTESEITASGKLKVGGKPAAIGGKATVRQAATTTATNELYKETGTPLTATTVTT